MLILKVKLAMFVLIDKFVCKDLDSKQLGAGFSFARQLARPRSSHITQLLAVQIFADRLIDGDEHGEFDIQYKYCDVRLYYLSGCQVGNFSRLEKVEYMNNCLFFTLPG